MYGQQTLRMLNGEWVKPMTKSEKFGILIKLVWNKVLDIFWFSAV